MSTAKLIGMNEAELQGWLVESRLLASSWGSVEKDPLNQKIAARTIRVIDEVMRNLNTCDRHDPTVTLGLAVVETHLAAFESAVYYAMRTA